MTDLALLVRVAGSLAAVLLVVSLAARFARRTARGHGGGDLHVRERIGLTRETAAVVLESGGRRLLIGVGPTQITLLTDLGSVDPADPRPPGVVPQQRRPDRGAAQVPLSRRAIRETRQRRRIALPPSRRGTGSVLDPRTWQQGLEALRDLTARR